MHRSVWIFILSLWFIPVQAQVFDVNDDGIVGPEEALELAGSWKGPAAIPNDHNHLGQTWIGDRNPLRIEGNFPDRYSGIQLPFKGLFPITPPTLQERRAPLMLNNTASREGIMRPDLVLLGNLGKISANENSSSELVIESNRRLFLQLNNDNANSGANQGSLVLRNGAQVTIFRVTESGNGSFSGTLTHSKSRIEIDHPLDPADRTLTHSTVSSSEYKNVYDGMIQLDGEGAAWVELPAWFEAFNENFRYQLTAVGGPAPNLHVAEKIGDNRFRIAGGPALGEVSWQVTGIRRDPYAKDHPLIPDREKEKEDKGFFHYPAAYEKSADRRISREKVPEGSAAPE